ncbi:MAG: hypothetical protein AABX12_04305 [Nanoarchaeota archaeon]
MNLNRKGVGEAMMFLTFFFIVSIVAAGIFWGVQSFYGKPYDFRGVHADVLAERISDCLKEKGFSSGFNLSICSIYVPAEEPDYLIYVNNSKGEVFSAGVLDYMTQCALAEKNDAYARCVRGSVNEGDTRIDYVVGVNRAARRAT